MEVKLHHKIYWWISILPKRFTVNHVRWIKIKKEKKKTPMKKGERMESSKHRKGGQLLGRWECRLGEKKKKEKREKE